MIYANEMREGEFPCKCAVMEGGRPFMNHCHPELEMIMMRRGRLKMTCEGEIIILEAGEICLVPPFGSHSIEEASQDCIRLAVLLEPGLMGMPGTTDAFWMDIQNLFEQTNLISTSWPAETVQSLGEIMEDMYREHTRKDEAWQLALKALADELLLLVVRGMPRCEPKPINTQVQKLKDILEYIGRNYCQAITLEDCAQVAGFNPTYFSRYFSRHMGVTFQEYVKKLRIDRARWLLRADKTPVTEISYQCGFKDIKTFNKLFKREMGMSPSQFRRESEF